MMFRIPSLLLLFYLACFAGCQEGVEEAVADPETRFPLSLDGKVLEARLAINDPERQKGLMHVESMPADEGMLFLFKKAGPQGFWMKNTLIPLDIGYFTGDGVLREIHRMYPKNLESVKSRSQEIQFCLEMNQGWFREKGIRQGAQLDLASLAKALAARGENPLSWGIGKSR